MTSRHVLIDAGSSRFLAVVESDNAPNTSKRFLSLLPLSAPMIHVRWSGEAIWIPESHLGDCSDLNFENHTSHPAPGDFIWYPGGYSETEILLAYGACSFSSKLGQLAGNHFMTIVEGKEKLYELGRKVLWEGKREITFSIASEEE